MTIGVRALVAEIAAARRLVVARSPAPSAPARWVARPGPDASSPALLGVASILHKPRATLEERPMPVPTPCRTHILIVEDDAAIGDMLVMLLESEGYRVSWRRSVATALAVLLPSADAPRLPGVDPGRPDMILLDLQLGASSGVTSTLR